MKVGDLKPGMAIKAKKGHKLAFFSGGWTRSAGYAGVIDTSSRSYSSKVAESDVAIYAGTREDVSDARGKWSNRYVMLDGQLMPFWPQDWKHCEPV